MSAISNSNSGGATAPRISEPERQEYVSQFRRVARFVNEYVIKPLTTTKLFTSRIAQIALVIIGVIMMLGGLVLASISSLTSMGVPIWVALVPSVIGLLEILVAVAGRGKLLSDWKTVDQALGVMEDIIDDGKINQSNEIFGKEQ